MKKEEPIKPPTEPTPVETDPPPPKKQPPEPEGTTQPTPTKTDKPKTDEGKVKPGGTEKQTEPKNSKTGSIVAGVLVPVILIAAAVGAFVLYRRRKLSSEGAALVQDGDGLVDSVELGSVASRPTNDEL